MNNKHDRAIVKYALNISELSLQLTRNIVLKLPGDNIAIVTSLEREIGKLGKAEQEQSTLTTAIEQACSHPGVAELEELTRSCEPFLGRHQEGV